MSFAIAPGRLLSVVGESGSGKSSLALAVLGALGGEASVTGEARYRGDDLLRMSPRALRRLWGRRLAMVFQDPGGTLNPVLPVGEQVVEVLQEHERLGRGAARRRMLELFRAVNLPDPIALAARYPHQLSGGQQQRVSIAIALACGPDVLILDEPTTGLDVTTEARILDLVADLRERSGAAILYITHNLGVVARLGDDVAVMYAGEVVEQGPVRDLFARPRHPYTLALMECLPHLERPAQTRLLPAIRGFLPDPTSAPTCCQFAPRCQMAAARCREERPDLVAWGPARRSRCFFPDAVPPPGRGPDSSAGGTRRAGGRRAGPARRPGPRASVRARWWLACRIGRRRVPSAGRGCAVRAGRRDPGRRRRERLGQDDARSLSGRSHPADGRHAASGRGGVPAPPGGLAARPAPPHPDGVPEPRSYPQRAADHPGRGRAPARALRAGRSRHPSASGPPSYCAPSGSATATSTSTRARSAAASASASPSRAPSRAVPIWSSATSRPPRWTSRSRPPS